MDNHNIIAISDDGGENWFDPLLVIVKPPAPRVRLLEVQFWLDPDGVLWMLWSQTVCSESALQPGHGLRMEGTNPPMLPLDYWDRRYGTWAVCSHNPAAQSPTWSEPRRLCDGFLRNRPIVLNDGRWLMCAYDWLHPAYSYYESRDRGITWSRRDSAYKLADRQSDETMMLERNDGSLWLMARTHKGIGQSFSYDAGSTWTPLGISPLDSPYSRFFAAKLRSGRLLLIHNAHASVRSHLTARLSEDDGQTWPYSLLLDERASVSYPDAAQSPDGEIHAIYDYDRQGRAEILMARFTESDVLAGELVDSLSFRRKVISKLRDT